MTAVTAPDEHAAMTIRDWQQMTFSERVELRAHHPDTYERLLEEEVRTTMSERSTRVGTPLRDAAVDPRPGDFMAPTNAGEPGEAGNPHGPHVRSYEVGSPQYVAAVKRSREEQ